MTSVGIRELKHETSAILRRVRERGETVDVTHRGRVVARIVPVEEARVSPRKLRAYWSGVDAVAKEISAHIPKGMTLTKIMRGARRG